MFRLVICISLILCSQLYCACHASNKNCADPCPIADFAETKRIWDNFVKNDIGDVSSQLMNVGSNFQAGFKEESFNFYDFFSSCADCCAKLSSFPTTVKEDSKGYLTETLTQLRILCIQDVSSLRNLIQSAVADAIVYERMRNAFDSYITKADEEHNILLRKFLGKDIVNKLEMQP